MNFKGTPITSAMGLPAQITVNQIKSMLPEIYQAIYNEGYNDGINSLVSVKNSIMPPEALKWNSSQKGTGKNQESNMKGSKQTMKLKDFKNNPEKYNEMLDMCQKVDPNANDETDITDIFEKMTEENKIANEIAQYINKKRGI